MANQIVSRKGAPFDDDIRNLVMKFIDENYGLGNITVPDKNRLVIDTKFGGLALTMENAIIVEQMPSDIEPAQLGGQHSLNVANFRIQVYCRDYNASTNKFWIEQELERIFNAVPTAIQTIDEKTSGFDSSWIGRFYELEVESTNSVSNTISPSLATTVARSYAILKVYYQKETVS